MLFFTSDLKDYHVHAADGEMGKVKDLYFDDNNWAIRYAVIDTRKWLPGRRVLLSPTSIITVNENEGHLEVKHDKDTIRNSPSIPEDQPMTQDMEDTLAGYYGWSRYWMGNLLWGPNVTPATDLDSNTENPQIFEEKLDEQKRYDLRSEDETNGFKVHADDGKIGTLTDMIFNSDNWKLQYMVVRDSEAITEEAYYVFDLNNIESVDWFENDIYINTTLEKIKAENVYETKQSIMASL
ncbi:PRC-barrel domain-containing protein [Virgibacillus halodenitrificans]|uniref:PRC-barrel domain-containing protein n=1 Tax=Virgibacillus halodenitrificans TaxID=1482 RepID=UPI001FB54847|nr:PRC-barrel domain-containing protein [Virgibacillus halodenitrificans]MCJ0932212.1 PRC-barrel domain-containing protein [Virgibacillus halodenitrificans]